MRKRFNVLLYGMPSEKIDISEKDLQEVIVSELDVFADVTEKKLEEVT